MTMRKYLLIIMALLLAIMFFGAGAVAAEKKDAKKAKKDDIGVIRTHAPDGNRFLVDRLNHSATTPGFPNGNTKMRVYMYRWI